VAAQPRPGTTRDPERNCVSNIRPAGLGLADATRRIVALMTAARRLRLTGVALKEDAAQGLALNSESARIDEDVP